jgi:hypothetical protein
MQTQLCIETGFFKLLCFVTVATYFDFMLTSHYATLKYTYVCGGIYVVICEICEEVVGVLDLHWYE